MLAIKLQLVGKKHQRHFRVVVAEKKSKLQGRVTADLGWFNPHADTAVVNKAEAERWLKNGALPTPSAHNVLVRAKVIEGEKIPVHGTKKREKEGTQG